MHNMFDRSGNVRPISYQVFGFSYNLEYASSMMHIRQYKSLYVCSKPFNNLNPIPCFTKWGSLWLSKPVKTPVKLRVLASKANLDWSLLLRKSVYAIYYGCQRFSHYFICDDSWKSFHMYRSFSYRKIHSYCTLNSIVVENAIFLVFGT